MSKHAQTQGDAVMPQRSDGMAARRLHRDRRRFTLATFWRSIVRPRRRAARRRAELGRQHVDHYEARLLWLCAGLLLLSVVDAGLTLSHADAAALNGVVAWLLLKGVGVFAAMKVMAIGASLMLLVSVSGLDVFRGLRVGTLLEAFLAAYCVLVVAQPLLAG